MPIFGVLCAGDVTRRSPAAAARITVELVRNAVTRVQVLAQGLETAAGEHVSRGASSKTRVC